MIARENERMRLEKEANGSVKEDDEDLENEEASQDEDEEFKEFVSAELATIIQRNDPVKEGRSGTKRVTTGAVQDLQLSKVNSSKQNK